MCPIQQGWAVVGRSDKFLSPTAIETVNAKDSELEVVMEESGPLVIWTASGISHLEGVTCEDIGNGFWKFYPPVGNKNFKLLIKKL